MNWDSHTQKIVNKILRTLGMMNRLERYLPFSALKLMFDSLILSLFQFGNTNWDFEWERITKLKKGPYIYIYFCERTNNTERGISIFILLNTKMRVLHKGA